MAAADPALMGVVVAVVAATGAVLAQWMARSDRGRIERLERDAADAKQERDEYRRAARRCHKALRSLGVDPDEFDDDDE